MITAKEFALYLLSIKDGDCALEYTIDFCQRRDAQVWAEAVERCATIAAQHTKHCHGITCGDCAETIANEIRDHGTRASQ